MGGMVAYPIIYNKVNDTTNTTIGKVNGERQYFSKFVP